jgi:hypothetical protein
MFFEHLDEIAPIEKLIDFADLEIFAKDHKLIDRHNGSFMFDLLKGGILSSCIAYLTVMFKDNF